MIKESPLLYLDYRIVGLSALAILLSRTTWRADWPEVVEWREAHREDLMDEKAEMVRLDGWDGSGKG